MLAHNPHQLLKQQGIAFSLLSDKTQKALGIYDDTLSDVKKFPNDKNLAAAAEEIGQAASGMVREEIAQIQERLKDKAVEAQQQKEKKQRSKEMAEQSGRVLDDLAHCRQVLKEERKRKIASGEIKRPVKKTLTSRLRQELVQLPNLIPKNLKGDETVLKRTERALLNFLNELKSIWGLNKVKPIADELKAKFQKLEESIP